MECKHERIKSVNCVIFCDVCGAKLPVDFLVAKERIKAQKGAEKTPEPVAEPKKAEPAKKKAPVKKGSK